MIHPKYIPPPEETPCEVIENNDDECLYEDHDDYGKCWGKVIQNGVEYGPPDYDFKWIPVCTGHQGIFDEYN